MSGTVLLIIRLLIVACLYTFLGWALYILWQNLRRQTNLISKEQIPPLTLFHQQEDDRITYRYTLPEVTIGRDPSCDCILSESTVSALHARLTFRHGQWWVEDLRSTNGTFLNQESVDIPLVVTNGDEVRCGQAVLSISMSQGEASSEI